jgi:glutaredoxin
MKITKASMPKRVLVTLYTRPGCHLCDEAKEAMLAARCAEEYTLDEVNIESDPRLLHSYRNDIPVIVINGSEAFRHRVSPDDFRRQVAMARSANDIHQR